MGNCAKCGKELSWLERNKVQSQFAKRHPEFNGEKLCFSCRNEIVKKECKAHNAPLYAKQYGPSFEEALEEGRRIVVVKEAVFSPDGIGKHIDIISEVAEKYGYTFKSETHFPDSIGIACSFIFERIIPKANETNFINCTHCATRYDANQYFKCPECGSPTTVQDNQPARQVASSSRDPITIKARCPNCQALNPKDSYECQECGQAFYSNEDEHHEALRRMEELEKEYNGRK